MTGHYPNLTIFLVVALMGGLAFWWRNDWGVYAVVGGDRIRKFEVPWWIQFPVSAAVGSLYGGIGVALACGVRWGWARVARRSAT